MLSHFHAGEIAMQAFTGESRVAEVNAPMISSRIAKGAVPFLTAQQFAVLSVESGNALWCTHIIGEPGFIDVPDPTRLSISLRMTPDLDRAALGPRYLPTAADPMVLAAADRNAAVGSIFIDLQTRMRYRINGRLSRLENDRIELQVQQAYGNCPKYITRRVLQWGEDRYNWITYEGGKLLSGKQQDVLRSADLLFIATGHPEYGLDASHRGGYPGFVTVVDERTLDVADYPGNSLFNSLGNLMVDRRIGLFIPDLARKRALRITGTATIHFRDSGQNASASSAPRLVRVSVAQWEEVYLPVSSSQIIDYSPFNPEIA
jgi:predicted pyridoxine 5'-phosphate oxidase superfamily flavin-nucleotide-binding protein